MEAEVYLVRNRIAYLSLFGVLLALGAQPPNPFQALLSRIGQKPLADLFIASSTEAAIQPKDAQLRVIVFHKNGPKDTVIGEADLLLSDLTPNSSWKEWHSLGDEKSKGKICLDINLVTDAVRPRPIPPHMGRKAEAARHPGILLHRDFF